MQELEMDSIYENSDLYISPFPLMFPSRCSAPPRRCHGGRSVRRPPGAVLCGGGVLLALRAAGRPGPGAVLEAGRGRRRGRVRAVEPRWFPSGGRREGVPGWGLGGSAGGGAGTGLAGQRGRGASPRSTEAVVVERRTGSGSAAPCVLQLECRPAGAGEIVSVGIVSEARNMEVYVGEEYCGTGRGESMGAARSPGETEEITLYKKYLKFECPAASCRIKLLSIGEKQRVLISKIIVQVKTVSAKLPTDFPSLGSSIDLGRVQTIMESMGSKLSPGAQQLMDLVRCQQKNSSPFGDKLNWIVLGKNADCGGDRAVDGLHSAALQPSLDPSASEPLPVKNHLTSDTEHEDLKISHDLNTQEQESGTPNVATPQVLLPFLQNLCTQVNHLRLKDGNRRSSKHAVAKEKGIQCVGVEQQPICSYLEKIISKNMDLMEKKLMDYIDHQMQALRTHIDNKMVLLMDLVQNSQPNKISQTHYDSNGGFSNGER
ncbi:ATPase PAAT [Pezoporus wallicus]|uniref:ATPase PAAT n=1 Tax=Pezoporus wallicus TaxID=35540 RepID=UPI00255184BC|nr:ATPase PAAT [Pezoporus wallicus]